MNRLESKKAAVMTRKDYGDDEDEDEDDVAKKSKRATADLKKNNDS